MRLGQQILAAFLGSLVLILFSLIPFLWLKIANWQPPQAWAAYAKDAIAISGAFTTAGTLFGLFAGLAWFNRQGGWDTNGLIWKRIVRYVLGVVGVLVLYLGLRMLFELVVPDAEAVFPYILRYIRYALVGAWISAGAPWLFVRLKLAKKAN